MQNSLLDHVSTLASADVIAGLEREVRAERGATARVIAWLVEVERRKLYLDAGLNSLFSYCVEVLGFSEDETCNRTGAVRAVLEYPVVLEMLEARSITMTTARLLYPHLKGQPDPAAVLRSAAGRSRREVERLIATLSPRPDVATTIRKVPVSPTPQALAFGTQGTVAANTPRPSPPAQFAPLSPDRYRLQVTISGSAVEKLELAQDMLSHALPKGDAAAVLEQALDLLLEDLARRRFATTSAPRPDQEGAKGSRHVPAAVKRAVWVRDRGRCAFVGTTGRRCDERWFVQFHHRHPHALGGPATVDNIALRCAAHNAHEARIDFGRSTRPGTGAPCSTP
jgi:hypothetical protein